MAKQSVLEAKKLEAQEQLVDQVTKLAFAIAALSVRLDTIEAKLDQAVGASEPAPQAPAKRGKKANKAAAEETPADTEEKSEGEG